eukprot:2765649-Pyramimonas_sp.AAC.1
MPERSWASRSEAGCTCPLPQPGAGVLRSCPAPARRHRRGAFSRAGPGLHGARWAWLNGGSQMGGSEKVPFRAPFGPLRSLRGL